jgi:hypothetical protein
LPLAHGNTDATTPGHISVERLRPGMLGSSAVGGTAEMQATNVDVDDYFNLVNALLVQSGQTGNHTPDEIPALVTFKINWHTVQDRFHVENAAETVDASVVLNESTVEWSAHEAASNGAPSFSFQSTSSTNVFSMLAKERNGRFFNS